MRKTQLARLARLVLLVLMLASVPAAVRAGDYREMEVSDGGTVSGRVYFEDEMPEIERIRPSRDNDVCGIRIASEKFIVDRDSGGLAQVVVRIEGISQGKPFAAAEAELQQLECRYRPHVMVLRPGQQMTIVNDDPVLHNVHAYRGDDTVFNMAQPFQGQRTPQQIPEPGIVRVACDVHDWMAAWILVLDSPYFSITDEHGSFTITDLPPGEYEVTMWHELLGTHTKTVTVRPGEDSQVDFIIASG